MNYVVSWSAGQGQRGIFDGDEDFAESQTATIMTRAYRVANQGKELKASGKCVVKDPTVVVEAKGDYPPVCFGTGGAWPGI